MKAVTRTYFKNTFIPHYFLFSNFNINVDVKENEKMKILLKVNDPLTKWDGILLEIIF